LTSIFGYLGATIGSVRPILSLGESSGSTGPYLFEASMPGNIGAVIKRSPPIGAFSILGLYFEESSIPRRFGPSRTSCDPLYKGVEHECKYLPDSARVDNESQLVREGPKRRGIDDSSKYNPKMDKAPIEGQRLMTAPAYPGVEASNKYGPAVMGF
jgi:hypothetical protein